mmetsp:Transcript_4910/g.10163  ORF Transcript_4910/g.10163 Transcript_4910/m.10163 type:complete len:422 (-) Transcript_4910:178-1443(-)
MAAMVMSTNTDNGASHCTLKALESWISENGGHGCDRIRLGLSGDACEGNGAVALKDIEPGQAILTVPAKLLLDATAASKDPRLAPFLKKYKLTRPGNFYAAVEEEAWPCILVLALHSHAGPRTAYIEALPSATEVHAASTWSSEELKALLPDNEVAKRALKEQHERMMWAQRALEELGIPIQTTMWAAAMFWSRALRVPLNSNGQRAETSAMTPYLDSLNHRTGQLHELKTSKEGHVVLCAGRHVEAGAPVYINYGAKSNVELLLHYGFVGATGPEDVAYVTLWEDTFKVRCGTPDFFIFPHGLLDAAREATPQSKTFSETSQPYQNMSQDDEDWTFVCEVGSPYGSVASEMTALNHLEKELGGQINARQLPSEICQNIHPERVRLALSFLTSERRCLESLMGAVQRLKALVGDERETSVE